MSEQFEKLNLAMRKVGALQALSFSAREATCMPGDKRTAELLDAVRLLINKAGLSAWEYANDIEGEIAERKAIK